MLNINNDTKDRIDSSICSRYCLIRPALGNVQLVIEEGHAYSRMLYFCYCVQKSFLAESDTIVSFINGSMAR